MQPFNPWLPRFAKLLVVSTFCLIFLGGMVTSVNAGLSVPDWPTSYGYNMFTFPISQWVGGVFFEHTHRLLASCVGLMTTVLVAWIWRNRWAVPGALLVSAAAMTAAIVAVKRIAWFAQPENVLTGKLLVMHVNIWSFALAFLGLLLTTERNRWRHGEPWLQWLGVIAFLLVCVQGTLGGLRVTEVSIVLAMIHACAAQAFLCLTIIMAAALSRHWIEESPAGPAAESGMPGVKGLAWLLVAAIYCQLMIGAVVRHLHAGLSIPDFPLAFGRLIPPMINERVEIHFAHRIGAVVVTLLAVILVSFVFKYARRQIRVTRPAIGLVLALIFQILLGAGVILTRREPVTTSLHVVNGALVLAVALLLAVRASRLRSAARDASHGWGYREAHA